MASRAGNADLVSYLIDKAVDINAVYKDKDGTIITALDACDEKGYKACSKLLRQHGATPNRERTTSANQSIDTHHHSTQQSQGTHHHSTQQSQGTHHHSTQQSLGRNKQSHTPTANYSQSPEQSNMAADCYSVKSDTHQSHYSQTPELYNTHPAHESPNPDATSSRSHSKSSLKKEVKVKVKISEVTETYNTNYVISEKKARSPHSAPVRTSQQKHPTRASSSIPYTQTMLPYSRVCSTASINVNSMIRKPKSLSPEGVSSKTSISGNVKDKVRKSVKTYETIRNSAREIQDIYLRGSHTQSARSANHKYPNTSSNSSGNTTALSSTSGYATPLDSHSQFSNGSKVPNYTVIATRGGFTKIRSPSHKTPSQQQLLHNLHQGKGNGILYVVDINSNHSAGFTQGFDGRLHPRTGLELKSPKPRT